MIEPYSISNPSPRIYKFLFNVPASDQNIEDAHIYIQGWAQKLGCIVEEEIPYRIPRLRELGQHGLFEIKVWLKQPKYKAA